MFDRKVVGEVTRLEVVETVHEHVHVLHVTFDIRRIDVINDGGHPQLRVDLCNPALCRLRLGNGVGHVALVEQYLPLQVGQLDEVPVHDDQVPDAGPGQHVGGNAAERAAAE